MDRAVASPPKVEGAADWISVHQGFALAYAGRLRKAKEVHNMQSIWQRRQLTKNVQHSSRVA